MKTLYIHIPFCKRKCFYCSFAVTVAQEHRIGAYLQALEREAARFDRERVGSVYIGGGTPTRLSHEDWRRLFAMIEHHFVVAADAEWTVEANPEDIKATPLTWLRGRGVNRISLGVQSLDDHWLRTLGRNHDAAMAREAYGSIREAGFDNVNLDLMFAFAGQSMGALEADVEAVLRLGSDHLSLYTLTIEGNSRFAARGICLDDDHVQADQCRMVCDKVCAAGFRQYEISNFAKPSKASQHNIHYWQGGEYIGLGVGAHSFLGSKRSWNISRLRDYLERMSKGLSPKDGTEVLTSFDQMKDVVLFGLRMNRGIAVEEIKKRYGCFLDEGQMETIARFMEGGFLVEDNGYWKATPKGRLVLDELCVQLV